jgi:hypothetical protein
MPQYMCIGGYDVMSDRERDLRKTCAFMRQQTISVEIILKTGDTWSL